MTAVVVRADALAVPLPDASVDLVVTSPPCYGLRSYRDGGTPYPGQIGSQDIPGAWLEALWAATAEMVRVLKPTGSIFVNLGDSYAGRATGERCGSSGGAVRRAGRPARSGAAGTSVRSTSPYGLPWRHALGCPASLGLILRAEIVWATPNGLPEPVIDRVRRAQETWFHFVRQPAYFAAVDALREPHTGGSHEAGANAAVTGWGCGAGLRQRRGRTDTAMFHPSGKLPGSVWEIASGPRTVPEHLGVAHVAAFPPGWPRRLVLGWSPAAICTAGGRARGPIIDRTPTSPGIAGRAGGNRRPASGTMLTPPTVRIVGGAGGCATPDAPSCPAVVCDPFGGTGTTALAACALGRIGVSVDRSAGYCRLAGWRTTDPRERARAVGGGTPAVEVAGQLGLFDPPNRLPPRPPAATRPAAAAAAGRGAV